jgi:hypothetical protein
MDIVINLLITLINILIWAAFGHHWTSAAGAGFAFGLAVASAIDREIFG